MSAKDLQEKLFMKQKNACLKMEESEIKKADDFCEEYKAYLNEGKTEREACQLAIEIAEKNGFVPFDKKGNYKVISQNKLKVRSTPSTDGQILGNLQPSELIEVISINNKWAKIKYKSSTGYVHTDYIKKL